MQMSGNGARAQISLSSVVTRVQSIAEARSLPAGSFVGDMHGGVTFSDAVARELERRSHMGWYDVPASAFAAPAATAVAAAAGASAGGTSAFDTIDRRWTVIYLNR